MRTWPRQTGTVRPGSLARRGIDTGRSRAHRPPRPAALRALRRLSGHQWFTQPSSSQITAETRQHLAAEEVDVLQGELVRHGADLEEHHQVADVEPLDHLVLQPVADGGGAAGDDVALVHEVAVAELLGVLGAAAPDWYGWRRDCGSPGCPAARTTTPARADTCGRSTRRAARSFPRRCASRLGHDGHQLEEARAVRIRSRPFSATTSQ